MNQRKLKVGLAEFGCGAEQSEAMEQTNLAPQPKILGMWEMEPLLEKARLDFIKNFGTEETCAYLDRVDNQQLLVVENSRVRAFYVPNETENSIEILKVINLKEEH